jgi:hypothetical protein
VGRFDVDFLDFHLQYAGQMLKPPHPAAAYLSRVSCDDDVGVRLTMSR